MVKLIIRIDDVHERMNWNNFEFFTDLLLKRGMTAILGVVPKCEDSKLIVSTPASDFWPRIEKLAEVGFKISQHGFRHVYDSHGDTIFLGNTRSEFAGLTYQEQLIRLSSGKRLLEERGFSIDTFMAPGHSFDMTTVHCLKELGFKYITDGYNLWPYSLNGLKFIPQLFSSPHGIRAGVYSTCFHLDGLSLQEMELIGRQLDRYEVIPFQEAVKIKPPAYIPQSISQYVTRCLVHGYRDLRSLVRK
jgi:predicted deacetylase